MRVRKECQLRRKHKNGFNDDDLDWDQEEKKDLEAGAKLAKVKLRSDPQQVFLTQNVVQDA